VLVLDHGKVAFDGPVAEGLLFYHRMLGTETGGSQVLRPESGREPIQIEQLELRDADDRPRKVFRSGEPVRVALTVTAPVDVERAVLAIEVRSRRGELCFRTDHTLGALNREQRVEFQVERLALLGGDYDLAAGAHEQDAPSGRLLDRVVGFSVATSSDGEGIADLRGSWHTPDLASPAEAFS
jgi:hypothetical protein